MADHSAAKYARTKENELGRHQEHVQRNVAGLINCFGLRNINIFVVICWKNQLECIVTTGKAKRIRGRKWVKVLDSCINSWTVSEHLLMHDIRKWKLQGVVTNQAS